MTTRQPSVAREPLSQYGEAMDGFKIHEASTNASLPSANSTGNLAWIKSTSLPTKRNSSEIEEGVPKNRPPGVAPRDSFGTLMSWDPVAALWRSTHNREETRKPRQNIKRSKIVVSVTTEPKKPVVSSSNRLNDLTFQAAREAANWMPQPCGNMPVDSSSIPMFWDGASRVWRSKQHLEAKAPVWIPPPRGLIPLDSFGDEMAWDGISQVWRSLKNPKEVFCSNTDNPGQSFDFSEFGRLVQLVPTSHRRYTTHGPHTDGIWRTIYALNAASRKWRKERVQVNAEVSTGSSELDRKPPEAAGLNSVGSVSQTNVFSSSSSIRNSLSIELAISTTNKKDEGLDSEHNNLRSFQEKDRNEQDLNKVTSGPSDTNSLEISSKSTSTVEASSPMRKPVAPCTTDKMNVSSAHNRSRTPNISDKVEAPTTAIKDGAQKSTSKTVVQSGGDKDEVRADSESSGGRNSSDKLAVRKYTGKARARKAARKTKRKKKGRKLNSVSLPVDAIKEKAKPLLPVADAYFLPNNSSSASTGASNSTQSVGKVRSSPRVLFTINGLVSPKELGKLLNPKRQRQPQQRSPDSVRHLSWE